MEGQLRNGSLLYREWIRGAARASQAAEVLGSLGVCTQGQGPGEVIARQTAYLAVFRAIVLMERASGQEVTEVERRWGMSGLDGLEERWRDEMLWLLAGWSRLLEVRCFYYHLREICSADDERVRRVEGLFRQMRRGVFELQEQLKYCSALGPLLLSLRRVRKSGEDGTVGVQTIRRLEGAGVRTLADLARLSFDDLMGLGIRRSLAGQLRHYVRRRLT
jgi:helicase